MKNRNVCAATCLIPLSIFFKTQNRKIQKIIDKLHGVTDINIQRECIKAFAEYIKEPIAGLEKLYVLKLLAFLYISCIPKHPMKTTLYRILSQVRDGNLLAKHLSDSIKLQVNYALDQEGPDKALIFKDYFITAFNASLELPAAVQAVTANVNLVFSFAFNFLSDIVDCLWGRKAPTVAAVVLQQRTYISHSINLLLSLLKMCKVDSVRERHRLKLMTCCYDIMLHKHVAYDIKGVCGHIIVLLFTRLPVQMLKDCTFRRYPYLEFVKFGNKQRSPVLENAGFHMTDDSILFETFKVCLYIGILIVAPPGILFESRLNGKRIGFTMFNELIELSKRTKGNSTQVISISKAVSMISVHLNLVKIEQVGTLVTQGLEYAVLYLEDKIETVKNNTRLMLTNFIKLAMKHAEQDNDSLLNVILHWLRNLPDCDTRYTAITITCTHIGCNFLLDEIPHLAKQLLFEMNNYCKATALLSCYNTLMKAHLKEVRSVDDWVKYWVYEIIIALRTSEPPLTTSLQRLYISAFTLQPAALKALTRERYLNTEKELGAFLGCLHSARRKGAQIPVDNLYSYRIDPDDSWRNLLEYETLEILQTHQCDDVRLLVLAIIVDTQRTTELYTEWELQFLAKYLSYNINTYNASKQQQILGYFKKGMTRVRDSIAVVLKNMEILKSSGEDPPQEEVDKFDNITAYYRTFWQNLFRDVLLPGLTPGSNHGRRSACLELLIYAFIQLTKKEYECLWDDQDLNNLKYILQFDTYERNKGLAVRLLSLFSPEYLGFTSKDLVQKHVDECFSLAISIKPMQTVSAAYMLRACLKAKDIESVLLERLSDIINLEELYEVSKNKDYVYLLLINLILELHNCYTVGIENLQEAAATKPIHGFVYCIRQLLLTESLSKDIEHSHWRKIYSDIIYWCFQLNKLVKTIICNASPEGYLPEDSEGDITETDETAKAQMLTVYGWRAAKEISLLLGEIVSRSPFYNEAQLDGLVDEEQIRAIGAYFFDLLVNTKHRGAFEQASIGFTNLCSRLWRLPFANLDKLPAEWLKKIFDILLDIGEETVETCATRRSAGVPFMVQAILTTEPHNGNEQFHSCMKTLMDVGGNTSKPEDQRIHCLNILRALYRNNQLNELVIPYCSQGMMIAIKGFGSNIWGIRNSATLLFSTLLIRMFGVPRTRDSEVIDIKNKMIAQLFFVRYPELYVFLLRELKKAANRKDYPTLFPVLLILSRLYRTTETSRTYQLDSYLSSIQSCLSNPVYIIRDLAAKTCVNLLQPHEVQKYIISCCLSLSDVTISNSYCHGILLQLQYLLQIPHQKYSLNVAKIIDSTVWIVACCNKQTSPLTATLYLDIVTGLIRRFDPKFDSCEIFKKVSVILQWQLGRGSNELIAPSMKKHRIQMFNLKIYMFYHIVMWHADYKDYGQITGYQNLVRDDIKNHVDLRNLSISYVNYLKFSLPEYAHHKLFEDDCSEYAPLIKTHLEPLSIIYKRFLYEILYPVLEKTTKMEDNRGVYVFGNKDASILRLFSVQCFPRQSNDKRLLLLQFENFCANSDETVVCTMIAYMDNFLKELKDLEIVKVDLTGVCNTILKFSAPTADIACRLGICRLLVNNKNLFYQRRNLLPWSNLCIIWEAVFALLEDDDELVRNTICQLCEEDLRSRANEYIFIPDKKVDIPDYAREVLLNSMAKTLPKHCIINLLLSFIFRSKEVTIANISEVFDEGELNTYAELYPLAKAATKTLTNILWTLEDGLNFEDQSIFIEEQTLIVSTMLYDKFIRNFVPLLSVRMNTALKTVFVHIILFLEKVVINKPDFKKDFRKVIEDALLTKAVKELDISEMTRLKMFLSKMFEPVLWK